MFFYAAEATRPLKPYLGQPITFPARGEKQKCFPAVNAFRRKKMRFSQGASYSITVYTSSNKGYCF